MRALADAQQVPSQPGIEHASAEQQQAARTQVFERQSHKPFVDRFHEDEDGGDDDHCTLESGREKRDALVSVKKVGAAGFELSRRLNAANATATTCTTDSAKSDRMAADPVM